jgi:hypothetical protein
MLGVLAAAFVHYLKVGPLEVPKENEGDEKEGGE